MPGFAVSLNGMPVCTVSTEGLNVLTVRVHAEVIGADFASIDMSGGHYEDENAKQYLTWLNEHNIAPGDEVEVAFLKDATTSAPGKTIDELYPDAGAETQPLQSIEEIFEDLAKQPKIHEHFALRLTLPSGEIVDSRTKPDEHSFGFYVMWDSTRPDTARASLTSATLENIEHRQAGTEHARFRLNYGQTVKLRVGN